RRLGRVEKLAETLMNHKNVLTHCNVSGELAMAAQICKEQGKNISFFATETRPYFQGSRLTAWELKKAKIPVTLVADNAVGTLLRDKMIDAVVVGSDRSCANGDFANKIGTLQIAVMAKEFGVPFYVLTQPSNKVKQGKDIPIEIRDENELLKVKGKCFAHKGVKGFYPGFDVVPRQFITKAIAINVNPATKGNASSELNPKERVKPESVQIARKQSFSLGPAEKKNSIVLLHGVFKDSFFEILKKKKIREVFVLEGRPYLDGAKELCPKLLKHKIQPVLIADNMAGFLFYKDLVKEVWISYQEEGKKNVLCKIGGLILSVMAKRHKVPVNVFPSGKQKKYIANPKEIFSFNGKRVAAKGINGFVPLLEDVPRKYITEIYS
ncbi:MAG: hypothetical protein PHY73_08725, partial [Candidatus Omnitrophica bacterium]|nr:hypothetical protein [Candidatus Omnitrophota bacterium]